MTTTQRSYEIANEINRQIQWGVKASLGFHKPSVADSSLVFNAKIRPFRKDGTRGTTARVMRVRVRLNGMDLYDIEVDYTRRGENTWTTHAQVSNVDVSTLNRTLLALDYDGPEAFNPRYMEA